MDAAPESGDEDEGACDEKDYEGSDEYDEEKDTTSEGSFGTALARFLNLVTKRKLEALKRKAAAETESKESAGNQEDQKDQPGPSKPPEPKKKEKMKSRSWTPIRDLYVSSDFDSGGPTDEESLSSESSGSDFDPELLKTDEMPLFQPMNFKKMLKNAKHKVTLIHLFKPGEYKKLCKFEKRRVRNIENKCTLLYLLGLPVPSEDILRGKLGVPRIELLQADTTDSESDEDWGPEAKQKKKKKLPYFKGISEEDKQRRLRFIEKFVRDRQSGLIPDEPLEFNTVVLPEPIPEDKRERIVPLSELLPKPSYELFKKGKSCRKKKQTGLTYNTRRRGGVSYKEEYTPEEDDFIFCDDCGKLQVDGCMEHPLMKMKDTIVKIGIPSRARRTCPPGLSVDPSQIRGGGDGIWCDVAVPKNTIFGPYEGVKVKKNDLKMLMKVSEGGYSWEIYRKGKLSHYIDGSDATKSNWLRYVNCARCEEEQNVIAFQYRGQIYYRTFKDVKKNTELFVWYGSQYAEQLGISCKLTKEKPRSEWQTSSNREASAYIDECVNELPVPAKADVECVVEKHKPVFFQEVFQASKHKQVKEGKKQCYICKKYYSSEGSLKTHVNVIHKKISKYKCDSCGKVFDSKSTLKIHSRVHSGEKPYKCEICGKRFSRTGALERHHRIHTGEKPFKCEICGKLFSQRGSLQDHRRIHTGEKPFKCEICGKLFSQRGSLQDHRRIHTGEKPFKCEICGKLFSQTGSLQYHRRIHTGEKPYKCQICGIRFAHSSTLKTHIRGRHKK